MEMYKSLLLCSFICVIFYPVILFTFLVFSLQLVKHFKFENFYRTLIENLMQFKFKSRFTFCEIIAQVY